MKSKLLQEAIADAKAVRETALENARAVLEEAFAPKLQSILSKKLEQELQEDEMGLEEFENVDASGTNVGKTNDAPHPMGLTDDDEIMNEGESGYVADDHTVDPQGASNELSAGPTDQDTDSTKGETSSEGPKAGGKLTTSKTDRSDVRPGYQRAASDQDTNQTPDVNTSNELTIRENEEADDELAAIIAELDGELDIDGGEEEEGLDLGHGDEDLEGDEELSGEEPGEDVSLDIDDEVEGEESVGDIPADEVAGDEEEDEEIDLEEILREMELGSEEESDDSSDELMQEVKSLREENAEYKKAFGYLKSKLNEVNLLNAKLLFTNKVFKSYGLNNNQKMRVVEAFDRARNTREVKLTYANLRESFNIVNGGKKKSSITEGIASKSVNSTKPSQKTVEKQKHIISEGNEMAARFKKLAGIK